MVCFWHFPGESSYSRRLTPVLVLEMSKNGEEPPAFDFFKIPLSHPIIFVLMILV